MGVEGPLHEYGNRAEDLSRCPGMIGMVRRTKIDEIQGIEEIRVLGIEAVAVIVRTFEGTQGKG